MQKVSIPSKNVLSQMDSVIKEQIKEELAKLGWKVVVEKVEWTPEGLDIWLEEKDNTDVS